MAARKTRTLTSYDVYYVGPPDNQGYCLVVFKNGKRRWMTEEEMPRWMHHTGIQPSNEDDFSLI